jgi:hypothetical protein
MPPQEPKRFARSTSRFWQEFAYEGDEFGVCACLSSNGRRQGKRSQVLCHHFGVAGCIRVWRSVDDCFSKMPGCALRKIASRAGIWPTLSIEASIVGHPDRRQFLPNHLPWWAY